MVQLGSLDIPNIYLGGGAAGIVIIIILFWFLFRRPSGRLGEEQEEETETKKLEQDEKIEEKAQKDEKKQCIKMIQVIEEILAILRKGGMGEIYDKVLSEVSSIIVMLRRMRDEKMSVERALDTFKTLHASLNEFITKLPKNNKTINNLVNQLLYYQRREYKDLITELMMDRDKKVTLRKLWAEVTDEQSGRGQEQAA